MNRHQSYLEVARRAALKAGRILMASYGKLHSSEIQVKSKNDFVTKIDRESEKIIVALLKKKFPSHSIQAEESGLRAGDGVKWYIDPLDGTSNYIHHFPLFAVSIGVAEEGQMAAAVIYDPVHKELFTAVKGEGARLNGKKFSVSRTPRLEDALMTTGIPFRARGRFDEYLHSLSVVSKTCAGIRRGGSAALDLAYVACGRFDGFWEINLSPWDIAAGALLIQEAGGHISDLWGGNDYLKTGDVLASNSLFHKELQTIMHSTFLATH